MNELKELMQEHYIKYASYVILERAIPDALDGLKPVQRRILHALRLMHDGKLHKVANVVGQTMPFHPHGDAPIYEALVNLANKELLLERQGNFGNPHTGDPAAAARYIETRLLPLSLETLFNPRVTPMAPSYDGRSQEPVRLPAKIPLLLLTGAEGIAVGMSTRIFPHNFQEVLTAEIAHLRGQPFQLLPDFPSGGSMDVSDYREGAGKVRLRASVDIEDDKTLKIRSICYSTTTESLIQSIEEAAKKGKIKIESIHDYTAEQVDIEIKLPRGQHAEQVREALFALTLCEVSLSASPVVIYRDAPCEATVSEIVSWHSDYLKQLLQQELQLDRSQLQEEIYFKGLERIFIEHKLYRYLEQVSREQDLRERVLSDLAPFVEGWVRRPGAGDAERLLALPMRRISRFDLDANQQAIAEMESQLREIERKLTNLDATAITYLEGILHRFGGGHSRRTQLQQFHTISAQQVDLRRFKVGIDYQGGFVGTKVSSEQSLELRVQDKLLVLFSDGTFQVLPVEEKSYLKQHGRDPLHVQVYSKEATFSVLYTSERHEGIYAKRFTIDQFILQRSYSFLGEGEKLKAFAVAPDSVGPQPRAKLKLAPTARKRGETIEVKMQELPLKSHKVRGQRLSDRRVSHVQLVEAAP